MTGERWASPCPYHRQQRDGSISCGHDRSTRGELMTRCTPRACPFLTKEVLA